MFEYVWVWVSDEIDIPMRTEIAFLSYKQTIMYPSLEI